MDTGLQQGSRRVITMNLHRSDGYPYLQPYQPMGEQNQQWVAVPTTSVGSMAHAQPPMQQQQAWMFMNPAMTGTTTSAQMPMLKLMSQDLNYDATGPSKRRSKSKGKAAKAAAKDDKVEGDVNLTSYFDGNDAVKSDAAPAPPRKNTNRKAPQLLMKSKVSGDGVRQSKRKSGGSRSSSKLKKDKLYTMEDIVQFSKFAALTLPSYTALNDIEAAQSQIPMIQPAYTPMQVPSQWGDQSVPIGMTAIVGPSQMIPVSVPVTNAFTAINTMQMPMSMEMMDHTVPQPLQKTAMMPLMSPQQIQTVPIPLLPDQTQPKGIVMEPKRPKSKMIPRSPDTQAPDDSANETAPMTPHYTKKVMPQEAENVDMDKGLQFPGHGPGTLTMAVTADPVMQPFQTVTDNTITFPIVHGVHPNASYGSMENASIEGIPMSVPINAFTTPTPPIQEPSIQSHIPIVQSQSLQDATPAEKPKPEHSIVDEIKLEKEALTDIQRDKIYAPRVLIESFQQVLDNKRRRMRGCLTEDCKNLLGEYTKLDTPLPIKWEERRRYFFVKDLVTTLLPYHMFYYESLRPKCKDTSEEDYSQLENEIEALKKAIIRMQVKSHVIQQAVKTTLRFKWHDIKIIHKVTQEYENISPEAITSSHNESIKEKKKRMIRYVYYDPTLRQKFAIMKARFFATGWIWAATLFTTYIAAKGLYFANRHFDKGRYCI